MYSKLVYLLAFTICIEFSNSIKLIDQFEMKEIYENNIQKFVVYRKKTTDLRIVVASIYYNTTYKETGWDMLEIVTNPNELSEYQAYGAGYGEATATCKAISDHFYNTFNDYCKGRENLCQKIYKFLNENNKWVHKMIKKNANKNSQWYQIFLVYSQIQGMYDGYTRYCLKTRKLSFRDILMINLQEDLDDLAEALGEYNEPAKVRGSDHCSAMIKLLPNNKDILIGHNAWNNYKSMVRMIKRYQLFIYTSVNSTNYVPGISMAFSGYPGSFSSIDDYYIMGSKLVTVETTIGNSNASLWKKVKPTGQIFESVRSVVANRLATNGQTWGEIFSPYNSGTYNNQWMIVDLNKFQPGVTPDKELLYVLEQIPGYIRMADQTSRLVNDTYWSSYNVPFYKDVFKMSGNQELVDKYGDWFSYDKTPRALIFKREHSKVKDVDSLLTLLRYNNYKNDPYAKCNCTPQYNARGAIAARLDLNPANGKYPFPALEHKAYGAIDAKATSLEMILKSQFKAICGPTTGTNLPLFKWSSSDFNNTVSHLGQPDSFDFPPVIPMWETGNSVY